MKFQKGDLTICGHGGESGLIPENAVVPPLYFNSNFSFSTVEDFLSYEEGRSEGYIYGRTGNPTTALLEQKLAALEHGVGALAFASGMGAITSAIMACLRPGEHAVVMRNTYCNAREFFIREMQNRWGAEITFIEGRTAEEFEQALQPNTRLFYLESPASAIMTLTDIPAVTALAKAHGIRTVMDNSWATPLLQKPLDMGVDISVHTMSKYIGGHSDLIGGAAITKDEDLLFEMQMTQRHLYGSVLGQMESWLAIRGLRSLPARLQLHESNAMQVADLLADSPKVERLFYPGHPSFDQYDLACRQMTGFTGLMSFMPKMSYDEMLQAINRLKIFKIACSWGGFESLALPATAVTEPGELFEDIEHQNLVRIYVGQESAEDLMEDLAQAFRL